MNFLFSELTNRHAPLRSPETRAKRVAAATLCVLPKPGPKRVAAATLCAILALPMNSDLLVVGFIQYVVFLLSTTCHEAAHALAAKLGGDMTAFEGGQVTLNPIPHIRREPFGMVLMPII